MSNERPADRLTRRSLLHGAAAFGGLALAGATTAFGLTPASAERRSRTAAPTRASRAFAVRREAAERVLGLGDPLHPTNGDEDRLPRKIACFSKGLPHDQRGEVDPTAFELLLRALRSGRPRDFESVPLGGFVKLANPQAALAFDLIGPDASQTVIEPPPTFASAEQAGELAELYWQALARDVPFTEYGSDPLVAQATEDLSRLSDFRGPREKGRVGPAVLFRGTAAGDAVGPYVSQFLLQDIPWKPLKVEQRMRTAVRGVDYLTAYDRWLAIQNGTIAEVNRFEQQPCFIRNGRDLGEYVHRDFTDEAYVGACLMALKMGVLPDGGNPYKHSRTQEGFTTFGQPYLLYLLAIVTQVALKACWFQKWMIHRRLRPEELGGRVENHLRGAAEYPLHADLLNSMALAETHRRYGTSLLPQAYPEGCPIHPSYPAGHAVIAGACVTVLKACFDESHVIPGPVEASPDGHALLPYHGAPLTVGGELDKLASNIAIGRNFAGLHWRSDAGVGLRLGETVAIEVLAEMRLTGSEPFQGFSLRRFDGNRVSVG